MYVGIWKTAPEQRTIGRQLIDIVGWRPGDRVGDTRIRLEIDNQQSLFQMAEAVNFSADCIKTLG